MPKEIPSAVTVRRKFVHKLMLQGLDRKDIIEVARKKFHKSSKTIDHDITLNRKKIMARLEKSTNEIISEHIERYMNIYRTTSEPYILNEDGEEDLNPLYDPKVAMTAMNAIEKLLKLHTPENQVNIQNNRLEIKADNLEELKKLLENNE